MCIESVPRVLALSIMTEREREKERERERERETDVVIKAHVVTIHARFGQMRHLMHE